MSEGTPENQVTYFTVQGHSHNGVDSTKIDFSGYDIYDFISEGDLSRIVLSVVNSSTLNPRGGIILSSPDGGGSVNLSPDVPNDASGLSSTCTINEDGATIRQVTWDPDDLAASYIIQLYRSIDSGSNYIKIEEITTTVTSHAFEAAPMANVTQTRYKLIVQSKSAAGILGGTQTISNIQPCVSTNVPAGPKFEDSSTSPDIPNLFTMFRGFMARLQEQTEADVKWGIGEFEYSVSKSFSSEGQWNHEDNIVAEGRQTSRIISVTGLETNTTYYLRVRAISNSNVLSPWTYWNGLGDDGHSTMDQSDAIVPTEITGTEITDESIKTINIDAVAITAELIATDAIIARTIKAGEIEADKIASNQLFIGHSLQSHSYTAGSVGFKIDYGGTAQFNGAVTCRNLSIIGDTSNSNQFNSSFHITDGSSTIFQITGDGDVVAKGTLTVGDYAGGNHGVNYSSGVFSVRGTVRASAGEIAGWTLDTASGESRMYTGAAGTDLLALDKLRQRITVGDGKALMTRLTANIGGNLIGDVIIGIDGSGQNNPVYGDAADVFMIRTAAGATKFSVGDKLTYDGTTLTVQGNITASSLNIGSGSNVFRIDSSTGNQWSGNATETSAPFRIKSDGTVLLGVAGSTRIRMKHTNSTFLFTGTALEFVATDTATAAHGYLQGVDWELPYPISASVEGVVIGSGVSNYVGVFQDHASNYGVVLNATISGEDIIALNADQGIRISQQSAPTTVTDKIYNVSGDLYWNGTELGSGGGSTDEIRAIAEAALVTHIGIDASPSSDSNSGSQVIQNITLDEHGHVVDIDIYNMDNQHYTEVETNSLLALKANLSGAAFSGAVTGTSMALSSAFASNGAGLATWGINFIAGSTGWIQGNCLFSGSPKSNGNGTYSCGESGAKWSVLYAVSTTINGSDENIKTDIENATYGLDFVNQLRPVTYKFIETQGRSGIRDHHGFIGQEVEALLGDDAAAMALWTNSLIPASDARPATYVKNDEGEDVLLDDPTPAVEEHYEQGLRYSQFIPILTKALQELSSKLDDAESRLAALEA